ncbi:class I SAM-dependent methyltransferase [Simiduia aestuariiviva]|uniref:23S rRNA (Cytosine1962-C5)-methyltransferase n=1 Tax=Simiduia aestuariiviva TaxID=1510459 RepID=A0A839UPT4_9GAMM|nr:class I SAM-dependent methyltransferase [Simiduia aestuariiviva]MBB3168741.1 23S rRNA (cytosine1962-C5)-methyltransferase [Simiduia aestuariiviva]
MSNPIGAALDDLVGRIQTSGRPLDSYRLFHGRGQCFDGLDFITVDWFDPVLLVTLFKAPPADWLPQFIEMLSAHAAFSLAAEVRIQHRYQAGVPTALLKQASSTEFTALRAGLKFQLNDLAHQNIGFFLDMEPGRQWLERHCRGKRVLNLFAYTCAFSVVAMAAGAQSVVNVDMSRGALSRGRDNHRINHQPLDGVKFLAENILKSWGRIRRAGPYDVVIFDPPTFQRGSFIAEKDYGKLARRLPELLPDGGEVLACLNAPELDSQFLISTFERECPAARCVERLPASDDFPDRDAERALKLIHFQCPPSAIE